MLAVGVGDDELVRGPGQGDPASVVQPVMVRADEDEIVQLGQAAVLPMLEVVGVQAAGRAAAGHHTTAIPMLQRPTQPPIDRTGGPAGADRAPGPFEPHLAGRIAAQVLAFGVGEQRPQMQRPDLLVDVDVDDHGGVLAMRAPRHLAVPAGGDQLHERIHGIRHRRTRNALIPTVGEVGEVVVELATESLGVGNGAVLEAIGAAIWSLSSFLCKSSSV